MQDENKVSSCGLKYKIQDAYFCYHFIFPPYKIKKAGGPAVIVIILYGRDRNMARSALDGEFPIHTLSIV